MSELIDRVNSMSDLMKIGAESMAHKAVDQLVVNGEGNIQCLRVRRQKLFKIATNGMGTCVCIDELINSALVVDPRYLGRHGTMFNYRNVVDENCEARPSLHSIITDKALCTEQERAEALGPMDNLASTILTNWRSRSGELAKYQLGTIWKESGDEVTDDEFEAFEIYMDRDPRFRVLGDGRIFIYGRYKGDIDEIQEIPPMPDEEIDYLIRSVLPYIFLDTEGKFDKSALLGTLRAQGVFVRTDQTRTVLKRLVSLRGPEGEAEVIALEDGGYRFLGKVPTVDRRKSTGTATISGWAVHT